MPFDEGHKELRAKEADGGESVYCVYCYKDGVFVEPGLSFEDAVEMGVPHLGRKIGDDKAREALRDRLKGLDRWK